MSYRVGDVVYCKFPYREDPLKFSLRPALVMKVLDDDKYKLAQITCTDRSDKLVGKWILKTSSEAKQMGLKEDSFINLSNILTVDSFAISRLRGTCPLMVSLEKECKNNKINY